MTPPVTLYGMSQCDHCRQTKEYLEERNIAFKYVNVDILFGEERNDVMHVLNKAAMFPTLPTLVVGEKSVVGFQPEKIDNLLAEHGVTAA